MGLVRVSNLVDQCYSNEDGRIIYNVLVDEFSKGKKVILSFANVEGVTTSFINSALIELLEDYSFNYIRKNLTFIDTTKQINNIINQRFKFEVNKRSDLVIMRLGQN